MTTPKDPPKFLSDSQPEKTLASFQDLAIAKEIILSSFIDELHRRTMYGNPEILSEIKKFFQLLWCEERLFAFFIPETLKGISEKIFTQPHIRHFVLNWTDSSAIMLSVSDYNIDWLIKSISQGVCLNKTVSKTPTGVVSEDNDGSLINVRLRMTLHIEEDVVQSILQKNFWLVCIIVLYL